MYMHIYEIYNNLSQRTLLDLQSKLGLLQVDLHALEGVLQRGQLPLGLVEIHHDALPLLLSNRVALLEVLGQAASLAAQPLQLAL